MKKNVFPRSFFILLFSFTFTLSAVTLKGIARDIFEKPAVGVLVVCPEAGKKTFTGDNGHFALEISGTPETAAVPAWRCRSAGTRSTH